MSALFMISLILSLTAAFASDSLKWKRFLLCDNESKYYDWDYSVEFMSSNHEIEAEIFRHKASNNCKGKPQFVIARAWKYELNENEIITTLEEVKVVVVDQKFIQTFNKREICGLRNWKINEMVSCEGKTVLVAEGIPGHRTIHGFKVIGTEFHLIEENGDKFKLVQDRDHQ